MYGQRSSDEIERHARENKAMIVDMRSDTISRPTQRMRQAMLEATVGDDVFGEDPTVKQLEDKAARLLGKEAAIFVTSGTMGNLISVMVHCNTRGCELYCGTDSHISLHEQGGASQLGGVVINTVPNRLDGTFDLTDLQSRLKSDWQHEPESRLIAAENAINGRVLPQDWIESLGSLARQRNMRCHLDGARLWNASVASGLPVEQIVKPFDSVTFCLSKALAAPAGSVLCGTREFVRQARRTRKVLGGGMRQVGVLAAAGIVALDDLVPRLRDDHRRAWDIATAIVGIGSSIVSVDLTVTHTNMIMMITDSARLTAAEFIGRLQCCVDPENEEDRVLVRGLALTNNLARLVTYYEIDDEMTQAAIRKIKLVIEEFENKSGKGS